MKRTMGLTATLILCWVALANATPKHSTWNHILFQARDVGCTDVGQIICTEKCSTVSLCVGDGSGGLSTMPVETCSDGQKCSADAQACVAADATECREVDTGFECHGTGYFPDPYNCTVYHVCTVVGQQPDLTGACDAGWAFDPLTTDCSLTQTDRVCTEGPVPSCETLGQVGAVPENPTIYYVCIREGNELIPELYKCPHGQIYDDDQYQCVNSL